MPTDNHAKVRILLKTKKAKVANRQIHKSKILKGGIRKRNQADHFVKGFRLFDTVRYKGDLYFIMGRRSSGFFDIRTLDGTKVNKGSISYRKLLLVSTPSKYLTERKVLA